MRVDNPTRKTIQRPHVEKMHVIPFPRKNTSENALTCKLNCYQCTKYRVEFVYDDRCSEMSNVLFAFFYIKLFVNG